MSVEVKWSEACVLHRAGGGGGEARVSGRLASRGSEWTGERQCGAQVASWPAHPKGMMFPSATLTAGARTPFRHTCSAGCPRWQSAQGAPTPRPT